MKYDVRVDLAALLDGVSSVITAEVLPTVHQGVKAVASEAAYQWKDAVSKANLWDGEKQPYIDSIRWMMTGDFSALVSTDFSVAEEIENGRPPRDLKRMLDTSMKVRTVQSGKNAGKRYMIIPFRHNTPGNVALAQAMPKDIYAKAKRLDASKVIGTGARLSGTGAMSLKTKKAITVPQQSYKWGSKLPAGLAAKLKETHATDIYAGMVRFKTSAGGGKSSSYMTFRVMMEGSPGWIVPAKQGLYLAKGVVDQIDLMAPKVFEQAIKNLK